MKRFTRATWATCSTLVAASLFIGAAGFTPAAAEQSLSMNGDAAESLAESVETYTSGDAQSALQLAHAGLEYAVDSDLADDDLSDSAPVALESGEFGLSAVGSEDAQITDGVTVYTDVTTDLDMVHEKFADGERIISVLGSDAAPTVQTFDFDLPESAFMTMEEDGSVSIYADVLSEIAAPGEDERVEDAVESILGTSDLTFDDLADLDSLSDEQIDALSAIPSPETVEVSSTELIGEVQVPWAVDANGDPVETHYEIDGTTLRQAIAITDETAFPVVADPSIFWWVKKASGCLAGVATMVAFGPAKVATVAAKIYKVLKAGKTSKLKAAFSNWNYLNKNGRKPFPLIAKHLKKFASDIISTRDPKRAWARMSDTKTGHQVKSLMLNSGTTVVDLIGLRSCYDIWTELS